MSIGKHRTALLNMIARTYERLTKNRIVYLTIKIIHFKDKHIKIHRIDLTSG